MRRRRDFTKEFKLDAVRLLPKLTVTVQGAFLPPSADRGAADLPVITGAYAQVGMSSE